MRTEWYIPEKLVRKEVRKSFGCGFVVGACVMLVSPVFRWANETLRNLRGAEKKEGIKIEEEP